MVFGRVLTPPGASAARWQGDEKPKPKETIMITRRAALLGIASISATGSAAARSAVSGSMTPEKTPRDPSPYPRPEDCEIYTSGGSTWARRFDGEAPNGLRFYTAWEIG